MSWIAFERDGAELFGLDEGSGLPVVFQHGLGGNEAQVAEVFPDGGHLRRLTLECRGQGRSSGDSRNFSIATFAEDVLAFADRRGLGRFVIGGISMGAAIALRLAIRHPERIIGLILARPAWLWHAAPDNMRPFADVARHLGEPDGLARFEKSPTALRLSQEAPDNLASLRGFFMAPDPAAWSPLFAAIAEDGPGVDEPAVRRLALPALVLGTRLDVIHPLSFAEQVAAKIAGAQFAEITPKATDRARYVAEFRARLTQFLSGLARAEGYAA
jgi:pimeloyl-ACP methyl ester carboxylesterase